MVAVKNGYKITEMGMIPDDWDVKIFKEIFKVNQGLQIAIEKRYNYPSSESKIYITIQYLNDGKSVEYINDYSKSVCCEESDVLMTRTGNTGMVITNVNGVFHNNFFKIKFDKDYIVFYLKQNSTQKKILEKAGTSTIPDLNHNDFYSLAIPLPPTLQEQKAIAEVLSSLDDKIELLQKQNETLEALAQTLFRQWFIEEADNSWEEYTIGRCAEIIKTSVKPEVNPDETFEHYSLPAYDNHQNPSLDLGIDIKSSKYKVINEAVLISKLNPAISRVWLILDEAQKNSICSTEFVVVKPNSREWMFFIYCLLSANETSEYLGSCASGTSGSHQRIKPIDVLNINFSFNDIESIRRFGLHVQPFFEKISLNRKSMRTLEQTRDTLLPRLMSGQVRIKLD